MITDVPATMRDIGGVRSDLVKLNDRLLFLEDQIKQLKEVMRERDLLLTRIEASLARQNLG